MRTKPAHAPVLAYALAFWLALPCETAFAADTPEKRAGEVSRTIPTVNIVRGGSAISATEKAVVDWMDTINTLASARARIALDDGSVLNVGSDSSIRVVKHDSGAQQTELELTYGKLRSQAQKITKPDGKFQVKTPAGTAGAVGTDFFVDFDRGNATMNVAVFDGVVKVCNLAGVCVELTAGQMTNVRASNSAGPQPPTAAPKYALESAAASTEVSDAPSLTGPRGDVAGMVMASADSFAGGVPLSTGSTIYSGELLKVGPSGHLQIQIGKSQLAFAHMSVVRIFRSARRTIVELRDGALVYSTETGSDPLILYAGDALFEPSVTESGTGRVSLASLCSIYISVSKGTLGVTSPKETKKLSANQNDVVKLKTGVTFKDAANRQNIPDWSDPQFHAYHNHVSCDAGSQSPRASGTTRGFEYKVGAAVAIPTVIVLIKALESPDAP